MSPMVMSLIGLNLSARYPPGRYRMVDAIPRTVRSRPSCVLVKPVAVWKAT